MNSNNTKNLDVKQRPFIIIAIGWTVISLLLTLSIPIDVKAQQTYEFKMGHAEAIGSPITNAFENWGKILVKRSNGRIKAKHFPAGQLGNYTQLIEGNRLGTIQATAGGRFHLRGRNPRRPHSSRKDRKGDVGYRTQENRS
jgi:C4-dicarboxylate-binding protein DctP